MQETRDFLVPSFIGPIENIDQLLLGIWEITVHIDENLKWLFMLIHEK